MEANTCGRKNGQKSYSAAVSFVPIIVIALAFGSYVAISSANSSSIMITTNNSKSVLSPCSTPYTFRDSSHLITFLSIKLGSTGAICMRYSDLFNNPAGSVPSYISLYQYNSSGFGVCSVCVFNMATSEFDVRATPGSVSYSPGQGYQDVTYKIHVPLNAASGVYGIFLLQICPDFPMVVELNNSSSMQVSYADFWYGNSTISTCPAQFLDAQILGVGGGFSVESVS